MVIEETADFRHDTGGAGEGGAGDGVRDLWAGGR